ncbi:TPA: hypothetical protein ACTYQH_003654 [Klebsiella michiganensis]|uniref:hypothetical protein n=1 Tax=Klebsiella michiganensis TaxID=1134687 RepID=UPI0025509246|nr:hypothetical protein [Klebsiella michiganensis]MDK9842014.1 hypothetical protein [Klebsiella michiganensis]
MTDLTVSQEFIDKAKFAVNKSAFWEIADSPVTIRLAMKVAVLDGERANRAARSCARAMLKRVNNSEARGRLINLSKATDVEKELAEFEAFRDSLIMKVAREFVEVEKSNSVRDYRKHRAQRIMTACKDAGQNSNAGSIAA